MIVHSIMIVLDKVHHSIQQCSRSEEFTVNTKITNNPGMETEVRMLTFVYSNSASTESEEASK